MNKILTIIIPTYNMEKYLRRCLDSLIIDEEGMKQLEVLVINDGSKDSSSQIAHEYQDKYPDTYRVIDKENGNYGSCINRGLKEATGKYVKVLDADDWFDTKVLATVVKNISEIDVDLVLTSFNEVTPEGDLLNKRQLRHFPSNQKVLFADYCVNPYNLIRMHSVIYRRKLLVDIKYTQSEGISYTDMQWVFSPMAYVKTAIHYPLYLYQYMLGREGQTMDPEVVKKNFDQLMKMIEGMIKAYITTIPFCDNNHKNYLDLTLKIQLHNCYRMGLLEKAIPNADISCFDESIVCANKTILDLSSSILIGNSCKFHYVKYWRDKGRIPLPTFLMVPWKILKILQIIKSKL